MYCQDILYIVDTTYRYFQPIQSIPHDFLLYPPPPRNCGSSTHRFLILFLLCAFFTVDVNAQNSIQGKLINGPGAATQEILSRQLVLEFYDAPEFETPPSYHYGSTSYNTSTQQNTYSISFSGGPFYPASNARVYVKYGGSLTHSVWLYPNCINTADLSLIADHANGVIVLSPLKQIAADVNIDGVITLADHSMLTAIVNGFGPNYDNSISVGGTTYQDVSVVYPRLPLPSNPLNFSPEYNVSPIGSKTGVDFASVRLGDVNGSCAAYQEATGSTGGSSDTRLSSPDTRSNFYQGVQGIEITPNPFTDQFSISSKESAIQNYTLFDLSGKQLLSAINNSESKMINSRGNLLATLPSGTYFVKIRIEDGSVLTQKIVKQ